MEIARISVRLTTLDLEQKSPATKGMVGAAVVFEHFGPEWDGLSKTAVFRSSTVSRDVTNVQEGEPVVIPWEVLEDVLTDLQVGICGHNRSGTLVVPTLWGSLGKIAPGAAPVGRPSEPPTPDWSAQLEAQVNQALTEARAVGPLTQQAADAATAANDAAASADMAAERALQAARDTNGFTETARKAVTLTVDNAKAALDAQNAAAESAAHANSRAGIASGAADRAAADAQAASTAVGTAAAQADRAKQEADRVIQAGTGRKFELLKEYTIEPGTAGSTYVWDIPPCSSVIITTDCPTKADKDIYCTVIAAMPPLQFCCVNLLMYLHRSGNWQTYVRFDARNDVLECTTARAGLKRGVTQWAGQADPALIVMADRITMAGVKNYNGNLLEATTIKIYGVKL